MHIELLWSLPIEEGLVGPASTLAHSLMYADTVRVVAPESDELLEAGDWTEVMDLFGEVVDYVGIDSATYELRNTDFALEVLESLLAEAATRRQRDDARGAAQHVRWASAIFREANFMGHQRKKSDPRGPLPSDLSELIALKVEGRVADQLQAAARVATRADWDPTVDVEVSRYLGRYEFMRRALTPGCYPLVDDLRGFWANSDVQEQLVNGAVRSRSANASLAVGQMMRLPSAQATTWDLVRYAREELSAPLVRFRAAMSRLSESAAEHPLDRSYEDYVEKVWLEEVAPALQELDELTRESRLRSLFFEDALGSLSTYAGPFIALAGSTFAHLPIAAHAVVAASTPIASTVAAHRAKRRAMSSHDFAFLRKLEDRRAQ
jgi:hypothetical protein